MSLNSPVSLIVSDATQLERLTQIRDKITVDAATEITLSDCKDFLQEILVELENKAGLADTQPISGSVVVSNLPSVQQVAGNVIVGNFPTIQQVTFSDAPLITESPLTTVGSTPVRSVAGYKYCTYQVDVTGIGTNAIARVEGNLIGSNFDNLNPNNVDTVLTQNKTYLFSFEGKINNIRFTLVSFSGGAPSITCHLLRGN